MSLKIYASREFLAPQTQHSIMLYPFWGKNPEIEGMPYNGQYNHYEEHGTQFFKMVNLRSCDYAIAPAHWENSEDSRRLIHTLADRAGTYGKSIIIFFLSDSDAKIPIENSIIFRTSFYKSKRAKNEYAMPAWSEDFLHRYMGGKVTPHPRGDKPCVGFCGLVETRYRALRRNFTVWRKRITDPTKAQEITKKRKGHQLRAQLISTLKQSKYIETDFIIRHQFVAGSRTPIEFQNARRIYVQNIANNLYTLCIRGDGNFSYRLYETLSSGRIPIFVDTDCVLPFDDMINWKKYCVWINQEEIPYISEKIADFHAEQTPDNLIEMQLQCRSLWEKWISPTSFFKKISQTLDSGNIFTNVKGL